MTTNYEYTNLKIKIKSQTNNIKVLSIVIEHCATIYYKYMTNYNNKGNEWPKIFVK